MSRSRLHATRRVQRVIPCIAFMLQGFYNLAFESNNQKYHTLPFVKNKETPLVDGGLRGRALAVFLSFIENSFLVFNEWKNYTVGGLIVHL